MSIMSATTGSMMRDSKKKPKSPPLTFATRSQQLFGVNLRRCSSRPLSEQRTLNELLQRYLALAIHKPSEASEVLDQVDRALQTHGF